MAERREPPGDGPPLAEDVALGAALTDRIVWLGRSLQARGVDVALAEIIDATSAQPFSRTVASCARSSSAVVTVWGVVLVWSERSKISTTRSSVSSASSTRPIDVW